MRRPHSWMMWAAHIFVERCRELSEEEKEYARKRRRGEASMRRFGIMPTDLKALTPLYVDVVEIDEAEDKAGLLRQLYEDRALVRVGCRRIDISLYAAWVDKYAGLKNKRAFVMTGKTMNEVYGLHDTAAYNPTQNILLFMQADMEIPEMLMERQKLELCCSYFDTIVDRNTCNELELLMQE